MKTSAILFFVAACFGTTFSQTREFVCTPCGNECDNIVYAKAGTCPTCRMQLIEKSAVQFENLSPEAFCQRILENSASVLLDVRSKEEFDGSRSNTYGHFKNAININITELEARLTELEKYKGREILIYCSHSMRSPRAAMILTQNGFKNVKNMSGGVSTLRVEGNGCLAKNYLVHD